MAWSLSDDSAYVIYFGFVVTSFSYSGTDAAESKTTLFHHQVAAKFDVYDRPVSVLLG